MLEILQFIFSSFWVFLGTLILTGLLVKGVVAVVAILVLGIRGKGNINIR